LQPQHSPVSQLSNHLVSVLLLNVILTSSIQAASQIADSFRYPLDGSIFITGETDIFENNRFYGYHLAVDLRGGKGTPVFAIANGTVKFAQKVKGLGYAVHIQHCLDDTLCATSKSSQITSVYYHLARLEKDGDGVEGKKLNVGDPIKKGDLVGFITGNNSDNFGNPHLHIGIRLGKYKDNQDDVRTNKWFYPGYSSVFKKDGETRITKDQPDKVQKKILEEWCDPITYILDMECARLPVTGTVEVKRINRNAEKLVSINTIAAIDTGINKSTNPAFFQRILVEGNPYTVGATDLPEYIEKVAMCNDPGCTLLPSEVEYQPIPEGGCDGTFCTVSVDVLDGQLTRVVFLYDECADGYIKDENGIGCILNEPPPPKTLISSLSFEDPNLKACVQDQAAARGWVYVDEVELLFCNYWDLSNLNGIEQLTGLIRLWLLGNQLTDITPLANLTGLIGLDLRVNQITDITPLANLTGLTILWLFSNQLTDITPLTNLTGLTYLDLGYNQITDITPLANLTNLKYLDLQYNTRILCADLDLLELLLPNLQNYQRPSSCEVLQLQ
jgi:murein DD-endopeptidase MepM/ murein hydrolase activator NlpD